MSSENQSQNKAIDNKSATDNQQYLITNTNIGKVRIGMQMKEIKKNYPNSQFKIATSPLDNVTSLIEVVQNNERLFYFTTENFSEIEESELPDEIDKIFFLVTDNFRFATLQGIKVGQTFNDAKQVYGEPEFFGEPLSDFVAFKNQAVKISFFILSIIKKKQIKNTHRTQKLLISVWAELHSNKLPKILDNLF